MSTANPISTISIATGSTTLFPEREHDPRNPSTVERTFAAAWVSATEAALAKIYPGADLSVTVLWGRDAGQSTIATVDGDTRSEDAEHVRRVSEDAFDSVCKG